jgi:hypothetical protein
LDKAVELVHRLTAGFVDLLLLPLSPLPAAGQLIGISLLIGAVFLLLFGKLSNQRGIRNVKRSIFASLMELFLFRHDLRLSLRAQGRLLATSFRYFILGVVPALVLAVPCILLLVQLDTGFGRRRLGPNEPALVRVKLRDGEQLGQLSLKSPGNVEITPPVRIVDPPEVIWRVTPKEAAGAAPVPLVLELEGSGAKLENELAVQGSSGKIFSLFATDLPLRLIAPESRALDPVRAAVEEFSIAYPDAYYRIGPWEWHWIAVFLVFSLLSGIGLSRFMNVAI